MFNGKIHYKWQFSIAMLVYQRVNGAKLTLLFFPIPISNDPPAKIGMGSAVPTRLLPCRKQGYILGV
jgi:hypothetical protein